MREASRKVHCDLSRNRNGTHAVCAEKIRALDIEELRYDLLDFVKRDVPFLLLFQKVSEDIAELFNC